VAVGTGPVSLAVNPVTNKIYVANFSSNNVTIIDGATSMTTTAAVGTSPLSLAVNPVTNKVYVANLNSNSVTVIDGPTQTTTVVAAGLGPRSMAVNPITNQVFVTNGSGNATILTEQQVHTIPVTTAISTLPNNQTPTSTPAFTFTGNSTFSPSAPPVDAAYFQLDTWQEAWTPPCQSSTAGSFTATLPPLSPGIHILYAYATDGQDASSVQPSGQSSPVIGNIAAYLFLYAPSTSAGPNPPSNLTVTIASGVILNWTPSTSNVVGYSVFRSRQSGGPYTKLNCGPTALTSYRDTTVQSGVTYFWVVTAVDSTNVESPFTNEVFATIP
jgi:YVTN family beta-propeller protein